MVASPTPVEVPVVPLAVPTSIEEDIALSVAQVSPSLGNDAEQPEAISMKVAGVFLPPNEAFVVEAVIPPERFQ